MKSDKFISGFTLIEILIVIAILSILAAVVVSGFVFYKKTSGLDNSVQEFMSTLNLAQNKTLSSENNSQYGVYINTTVSPNQYVLFKGASYASDPANITYSLQNTTEFYGISLGGGVPSGSQIVFDKLTGASEEQGSVSIRVKADTSQSKTVYIASSGVVSLSPLATGASLDTNRVKDSRHVQFSYSRTIDTANETITLTFDNNQTKVIPISSYLSVGELKWQDTVSVAGVDQTIEIDTHYLNDPVNHTLFSIRRDRRYNNRGFTVTISGDGSGYLAQYSADGLTTNPSSVYVSDFAWQ